MAPAAGPLLSTINFPDDLKKLGEDQLPSFAVRLGIILLM